MRKQTGSLSFRHLILSAGGGGGRKLAVMGVLLLWAVAGFSQGSPRERVSFNAGWRFTKADPAGAAEQLSYSNLKAWLLPARGEFSTNEVTARPEGNPGAGVAFAQADFNDSDWRLLNLPHDWGVEGPFNQAYPGETGKLPWWGTGWYRKHLDLPAGEAGHRIFLDLDGAMSYATV